VLLLNRNASAATITVRFSDLGLGATASVRNVWMGMDLGSKTTSYGVSVPAHDSVLLLVTEAAAP
jgi:alpha-galactosidase